MRRRPSRGGRRVPAGPPCESRPRRARGGAVCGRSRFATSADAVGNRAGRPSAHERDRADRADLPGVGRNLQDHLKLSLRWKGRTTLPGSTVTAGLFTSSHSTSPPDLQFYVGRGMEQPDDVVTITVSLVRPHSRGSISLRSADPLAAPVIRANYLHASADVMRSFDGARLARQFGARAHMTRSGWQRSSLEQNSQRMPIWSDSFARRQTRSITWQERVAWHPRPTRSAVVDADLRVHGIEGLRVADASVMPEVVNAPTHAACVVIGEKCATLISGR